MVRPPQILALALGRDTDDEGAKGAACKDMPATFCGLSGEPIPAGAPRRVFAPSKSAFTNWGDVRSNVVSVATAISLEKPVMRMTQKCVITESGIYPMSTFSQRAGLLLEPPAGLSVWVYSTLGAIATQHLVWRATVTRDADQLIYLCYGGENFPLRRRLMLDAVDACRAVVAASVSATEKKDGKKKSSKAAALRHPFVHLDPGWDSMNHGVLRTDLAEAAVAAGKADAVQLLRRLTSAEKWMMMPLLFPDKHPPSKPSPTGKNPSADTLSSD